MKSLSFATLIVLFVAFSIVFLFSKDQTASVSFFDGSIVAQETKTLRGFDSLVFSFSESGDYKVAFVPLDGTSSVPQSFDIHIDAPKIITVSKFSLNPMNITIIKGDSIETQELSVK